MLWSNAISIALAPASTFCIPPVSDEMSELFEGCITKQEEAEAKDVADALAHTKAWERNQKELEEAMPNRAAFAKAAAKIWTKINQEQRQYLNASVLCMCIRKTVRANKIVSLAFKNLITQILLLFLFFIFRLVGNNICLNSYYCIEYQSSLLFLILISILMNVRRIYITLFEIYQWSESSVQIMCKIGSQRCVENFWEKEEST